MLDTKALAQATAAIVREHVGTAVAPLLERIAALEARELVLPEKGDPGDPGRNGTNGKDADLEAAFARIDERISAAFVTLPVLKDGEPGRDGKDVDIEQVRSLISEAVAEAVPPAVEAVITTLPPAERGETGQDGRDADMEKISGQIDAVVKSAVDRLPAPKDGEPGKDGLGLADAIIDRAGELVLTMTDGRMKSLGPIVGRDGKHGEHGSTGIAGRDGQGLSDIEVTQDGSKIEFAFQIGETRSLYEIELPAGPAGEAGRDAYPGEARGLYDPDAVYRAMDVVSFNGSEWRAKQDAPGEMPGPGWMLSAQKGKRGERGEIGCAGRDGVSPVAQYLRGSELVTTLSDGAELNADLSDLTRGE